MNQAAATTSAPDFNELLQRVDDLRELIAAQADAAEQQRRMSDVTYRALHDAGLFHMMTPRELGGSELPWSEGLAVAERVAQIDGSPAGVSWLPGSSTAAAGR